jgi:hypothetical protein
VTELVLAVQKRVLALLAREGLLDEGKDDALRDEAPALADCYTGAVTQRVGVGPQRGRPVMKIRDTFDGQAVLPISSVSFVFIRKEQEYTALTVSPPTR